MVKNKRTETTLSVSNFLLRNYRFIDVNEKFETNSSISPSKRRRGLKPRRR